MTLHHPGGRESFPFLLLFAFSSFIHPVVVAASARQIPRPRPIEAALDLLHWFPAETPEIVVVDVRPPNISVLAEAWTVFNREGCTEPVIYVAGWSELYRNALADPRDAHSLIRLAGVLAHERVHLRQGPDEESAYAAQLTTLERLQAPRIDIVNVRRALEAARRHRRRH